jgi:hypothetical protein
MGVDHDKHQQTPTVQVKFQSSYAQPNSPASVAFLLAPHSRQDRLIAFSQRIDHGYGITDLEG